MKNRISIIICISLLVVVSFFAPGGLRGDTKMKSGHIVINEVCSNNFALTSDENGEYEDYVELYNPGSDDQSLTLYLSDNSDDLKKYKVEEDIPPYGFLVVWLSGAGKEGYLHAGFKLAREGEQIFLSDESGKLLDIVNVPALRYDQTYSRQRDGENGFAVLTGTPGSSNEDAIPLTVDFAASPVFSLEDGFYDIGTHLKISAKPWQKIYYTVDGSVPDENSTVYKSPLILSDASDRDNYYAQQKMYPTYVAPDFKVDKANVVRAVAVDILTGRKSRVVTHTYFCGFDDKELYKDVPVISLVFDPDDLFNYENGIFALGKMYDLYKEMGGFLDIPEEEVPSHFTAEDGREIYRSDFTNAYFMGRNSEVESRMSVFDKEHKHVFSQNTGVRVAGESSRYNFQKSLNLYARDIYEGRGVFYKGFFDETEKKVRLRRSDNRIWFQEPMLHSILGELGLLYQDCQMEALFINGEYWGAYNLREQYDDYYFKNHLGLDDGEFWVIKNNEVEYGPQEAFDSYDYLINMITYSDASDDEIYDLICQMVDIDNLIDYFCALLYFDDEDIEPRHNQILFRSADDMGGVLTDTRWRWMVYDLDVTLGDPENNTFEYLRDGGDGLYLPGYLYSNEKFRSQFRSRMTELMDTTFSYEHMHQELLKWDLMYRKQNIASVERFDGEEYTESDYEEDLEDIDEFFLTRRTFMEQFLEEDMNR